MNLRDTAGMNLTLRILHLEDDPDFSLWLKDFLASDGLESTITHVVHRAEYELALANNTFDIIIADWRLPDFNGLTALKLARDKVPQIPFILMSGTIGEGAAIEVLKAGATDYVLKHNRNRLPAVVRRAVGESVERARREAAEDELRWSEKQYRLLFQGNPHPMWVFDLEKQSFLEVNEAAISHYGYSREEFHHMKLSDLRAPDHEDGKDFSAMDPKAQGLVWTHRRKDGGVMDMEVIWSPLVFRGKLAALTLATDITTRRRVARQNAVFRKLIHHLSAVTTASEAAMFICEAADDLFHWDDFALDLYLPEADEVVSLLTMTTIDGHRVEVPASPQPRAANTLVQRVIERGAELFTAAETEDQPGTTMMAPIREGEKVVGVFFIQSRQAHSYTERDLETLQTLADQCGGALQRVRVEEQLRHSQRRFRQLFQNSPDAIFVEDLQGKVLDANASACDLHGLALEQLIGRNALEDLVPPASREKALAEFPLLVSGQITWIQSESLRSDGRSVPVEIRTVRIEYDGQPAMLFHVRDITERRAAEMALRSSETLFRSVWENSADGIRLADEKGTIVAVNQAFCRMVGLMQNELEGQPLTIILSPKADGEKLLQKYCDHFYSGSLEDKQESEYTLHNGRTAIFEVADSYVESDGKPRLLLSMFRDVTSQRRLEEQLRQAQKMEAIGQLAGGIAHDFNNILTVILGHASLLTMAQLPPKAIASAQQIKQASERAAGLTRQLLAFGRKQIFNPRPIDLNRVISKLSDLLTRLLGEDVMLQLNFSSDPAVVEADASMMEQILLNLSVNSRDAMPKGGNLNIQVSVVQLTEAQASQFAEARAGRFVCLQHRDTGCGIPPENQPRIFEPFFTTKELGKGTGLGLATVYGIVKQHQGWIQLESELGKGSEFKIFLPASKLSMVAAESGSDTHFTVRGGTETILVVEDERDLREIITRTLNHRGYRVFQAVDGRNALQIWSEYKNEIDLVFTDIIMPGGMNGRELAEKLVADKPDLKVIFSSGYGADTLGKDFKLAPAMNYLQKPYLPQTLARTIRRCLDGH